MNKVLFQTNLKNENYYDCINDLRKENIDMLSKNIQKKDKFFFYSTTKDLYNKSKNILSNEETEIAYRLYSYDIMEENDKFVLDDMLEMYKTLIQKT